MGKASSIRVSTIITKILVQRLIFNNPQPAIRSSTLLNEDKTIRTAIKVPLKRPPQPGSPNLMIPVASRMRTKQIEPKAGLVSTI
jgi:hypothetical protein